MSNGQEFDPVASAARAALDTTRRGIASFQNDTGAPDAPAQSQMFQTAQQAVDTVARLSPFNLFGQGDAPVPGTESANLPEPPSLEQPDIADPLGLLGDGGVPNPVDKVNETVNGATRGTTNTSDSELEPSA